MGLQRFSSKLAERLSYVAKSSSACRLPLRSMRTEKWTSGASYADSY